MTLRPMDTSTETPPGPSPLPAPERGGRRRGAVLVTGAAGEVGHGLILALHAAGRHDVVAIDVRKLDRSVRDQCLETYVGDICDTSLLGRSARDVRDHVRSIHLAALLSTRAEFTPETAHDVNVGGHDQPAPARGRAGAVAR